MLDNPTRRQQLEQAAALLDTAREGLASVQLTIDGRLATFEATGPDWKDHPQIPRTQVRRLDAPAGAPYSMLELRAQAGAEAEHVRINHDTDVHVLAGLVHVGRELDAPLNEPYGAGSCCRLAAEEPHAYQVLQDLHSIFIFHTPIPAKKP